MEEHDEPAVPDTAVDAPAAKKPRTFGQRLVSMLLEGTLILVGALIISTLLRTFVAQMFVIPSGSMENTLQVNDRVLVAKFGGFQRGDVVVFEDPANWLTPSQQAKNPLKEALEFIGVLPNSSVEHLIKRVIGMPGDHVKCCTPEGLITVNGVELDETAYLYSEGGVQVAPSNIPFDVIVPAGHIFVVGDHRNASADSRCRLTTVSQQGPPGSVAFVPVDKVVGAAVSIVAPLERLSTFTVPASFAAIPAPELPAPEQATIIEASPGC